jgi:pimeloyl-ACP methyl ester carboxylesterase
MSEVEQMNPSAQGSFTIRPFRIDVRQDEIEDLERRIRTTRWPASIEGSDWSLGMDGEFLRSLASHWVQSFDWSAIQSRLNRFEHFQAVRGSDSIHFVRIRATGPSRVPIILTHGWPSTFAEFLALGTRLADPTSCGADPADSFDVVIPSLPGFAFSSKPDHLGTNVLAIADDWAELMSALGYSRFVAHGGDLGAGVSTALGLHHPERLHAIHLNYIPGSYQPAPDRSADLSAEESAYFGRRGAWLDAEGGYSHLQATKPDVLAPALNDSPMGLAAWVIDKFRSWSDCQGELLRRFSYDELLTTVSIYWFTQSMPSAIRLYWEGRRRPLAFAQGARVSVPVAVAHFPRELPIPPRSYVERGYNVQRWTEMPRGGHFAALEEPDLLADDIRSFLRALTAGTGG